MGESFKDKIKKFWKEHKVWSIIIIIVVCVAVIFAVIFVVWFIFRKRNKLEGKFGTDYLDAMDTATSRDTITYSIDRYDSRL